MSDISQKIAFIIPTYPPDYKYAYKLIETYKNFNINEQTDLYFVFTNEDESNCFDYDENKKIILNKELRIFENGGIINIKKYYGLIQLKNKYDYLIVLDSEIEFVKNIDIYSICENIYKSKELFGNTLWLFEHSGMNLIRERCKSHFKYHPLFSKLVEEEKDLYLWFSNLPVYKSEYLDELFEVLQLNINIKHLNNYDFDHYIYMYYLILYHDFKVKDLNMHGYVGAGESMPEGFCFVPGKELKHKFNMCAKSALSYLDNEKLFIVIQIDRTLSRLFWIIGSTLLELSTRIKVLEQQNVKDLKQKTKLYKFLHLYWLRGKK